MGNESTETKFVKVLSNDPFDIYQRDYRKRFPEKRRQYDRNYWAKKLRSEGYIVIAPEDQNGGVTA